MKPGLVDDNLRLIFVREEMEFVEKGLSECRLSLIYAGGWLGGYALFILAMPLLHKLFVEGQAILYIGFLIATVVSLTMGLLSLRTICQLIKYLKYRKNYRKFMNDYNRQISDYF